MVFCWFWESGCVLYETNSIAAWVQAFASVGAIVWASRNASKQGKEAFNNAISIENRRARQDKADIMLSLSSTMDAIPEKIEHVANAFSDQEARDSITNGKYIFNNDALITAHQMLRAHQGTVFMDEQFMHAYLAGLSSTHSFLIATEQFHQRLMSKPLIDGDHIHQTSREIEALEFKIYGMTQALKVRSARSDMRKRYIEFIQEHQLDSPRVLPWRDEKESLPTPEELQELQNVLQPIPREQLERIQAKMRNQSQQAQKSPPPSPSPSAEQHAESTNRDLNSPLEPSGQSNPGNPAQHQSADPLAKPQQKTE